jgi:hypothetical protein
MKRIAIHSVPRSGSSWIAQIFNSVPEVCYRYQPLFSYAFKNALNMNSTKTEIVGFFESISRSSDSFLLQEEQVKTGGYPSFKKALPACCVYKEVRFHHILENLLAEDDELIAIGIVRNPLAVIYSWLNAPKEFRRDLGWDELQEWRNAPSKNAGKPEEFNGYEKWKEVARLFLRLQERFSSRFYLVHYDRFVSQPVEATQSVFDFCGIEMHEQTLRFLQESSSSSSDDAYSVFRNANRAPTWKTMLNPKIREAIVEDLAHDPQLGRFL